VPAAPGEGGRGKGLPIFLGSFVWSMRSRKWGKERGRKTKERRRHVRGKEKKRYLFLFLQDFEAREKGKG